ncbi:MAG TPA: hypothetical protein VJW94_18245 [Candidatus Acidoferrum sp.]|nr:hypothetical protein [Candidatus Acidoferrum sp.]
MATSSILPDVAISFPEDFETCSHCRELVFVVNDGAGMHSICGCTAEPPEPAVAVRQPHSPQSPLVEAFAMQEAA